MVWYNHNGIGEHIGTKQKSLAYVLNIILLILQKTEMKLINQ